MFHQKVKALALNLNTPRKRKHSSHKFDKSKIRLVILADSDRGRTPFFDSDAIKLVDDVEKKTNSRLKSAPKAVLNNKSHGSNHSTDSSIPSKDGPKYRFQKLGSDVKVLEEMMFGTVPMAYKGSSLKVHVLRSPHKLMITKVFIPEKPRGDSVSSDVEPDSLSLVNSMMDFSSGESFSIRKYKEANNKSKPMDVPRSELSDSCTDDDIGFNSFTSSGSLASPFPSPSNNSLSSYSSLHKRWMRSQTTSFNSHQRRSLLESSLSSEGSTKRARRQKLAIAILFGSHDEKDEESVQLFQSFVFSHFPLIESHVEKLRAVIEKAYFNFKTSLIRTMEALDQFRQDIHNLYMAPRLVEPVWLTMMSNSMYRPQLCDNFMKEFNALVTHYDKKDCKFFVSTLLSAVLTQHLTWVATVTPAGGSPTKTYLEKHSAKWVETLAKTHPYNPLWAQLGDIFGAIGPPLKISRTIVVGKKADLVKRFLHILSYFIRCSDVHERENPCSLRHILNDPPVQESMSPTLSEKTMTNGYSSDDRNSLQSPVYSRQASCGSSGVSVFLGSSSNNGEAAINMVPLVSQVESVDERKVNSCIEVKGKKEPNVIYCDNSVRNALPSGSRPPKQSVIKDNSVFNGTDVVVDKEIMNSVDKEQFISERRLEENELQRNPPTNLPLVSNSVQCSKSLENGVGHSFPLDSSSSLRLKADEICVDDSVNLASHKPVTLSPSESALAMSELHTFLPDPTPACSLTPLHVPTSPTVENVQHVKKSIDFNFLNRDEAVQRSASFSEGNKQISSRLSKQLENSAIVKGCKPTTAELKKLFASGGTSSMFDEYYETNGETKSADYPAVIPVSSVDSGKDTPMNDVKSSLARHLSIQEAKAKPAPVLRCKSITPDLSRRRHLSSTSSLDYDTYDPLTHGKEVKLPFVFSDSNQFNIQTYDRNFGRSLLAGYSEKYMSDFVLLGTSDKNFKTKLLDDLQTIKQSSFLDEHIEEAVCVIADTDTWTVEVASSKMMRSSPTGCTTWSYSKLVADLIESVVGIYKLKMGAEFCLMHLEDRLQEIYFKSFMLAEYLQDPNKFSQQELTTMLGFEQSDMTLLFAVAGTHNPSLLTGS